MLRITALAALALGACSPSPVAPSFALVAYGATESGELHRYVMDSGLTVDDCAQALDAGAANRLTRPASLRLLTCETESK